MALNEVSSANDPVREARVDLAAFHRLAARFEMDDGIMDHRLLTSIPGVDDPAQLPILAGVAYIEELARFVDTKMRTIGDATGTSEPLKVAILAALNIADELFKAEERERTSDDDLAESVKEAAGSTVGIGVMPYSTG